MTPTRHILQMILRRPFALLGIFLTSGLVAALWGANIGTLYPMVEIVFQGDSIPDYMENQIEEARLEIERIDGEIRAIDAPDRSAESEQTLAALNVQRKVWADAREHTAEWLPTAKRMLPGTPFRTLLLIVGMLMAGTAIKLISLGTNLMLVRYISERVCVDLRGLFFRRALHLDLDAFGENGSADLTARMTNDTGAVAAGVGVLLGRVVREPLKMIVCLGWALMISPRLLLLVMIVTPLMAVLMNYLSKAIRRASRRAMEEMSQLYGLLSDAFAGIRVVKAFNTQAKERAKFRRGIVAFYRKSMKMSLYNTLARSTSELLGMTTVSLAIVAGGYLVINQETHLLGIRMTDRPMDVGQMLLFFGMLIGASDPARKLADVWANLQRGLAASSRVFEIIDKPVRVTSPRTPKEVARPHHQIEFSDVSFCYPNGPRVLRGIDLTIRHGETIAVVGPNGSGKSTLVSLLCRFDDPQSGRLMLDGVPLSELAIRDLRRRIALVTQRTVLFDDTIENNIRYGSPGADSHAVVRAAKLAHADEFIRHKTPDGYATVLGAGGMQLSGGQMQRIALARAFLRDPDILILDEATSAIDLESERLIHEALAKFLVDRTGVMITHRPSSLSMADRIVVIDGGRVADSGSHASLLAHNAFYRSLCSPVPMAA